MSLTTAIRAVVRFLAPRPEDHEARRDRILQGPLTSTMLQIAAPLIIGSQLDSIVTIITMFWVGRLAGTDGLGVMVVASPVVGVSNLLVSGTVCAGTGALLARSIGANDGRGLSILRSGFRAAAVMTGVWVLAALVLARPICELLTGDAARASELLTYYVPALALAFPAAVTADVLLESLFASGWTAFGLARMTLEIAVLFALVPLFMGGLGLGMVGPPLAQLTSAAVLCALMWRSLQRHREQLGMAAKSNPRAPAGPTVWREIVAIGLPPHLGRAAIFFAQIIYFRILADDEFSVVAFGVAFQVVFLVSVLCMTITTAMSIVLGQNLGARQLERSLGVLLRGGMVVGMIIFAAIALTPYARPVLAIFSDDPRVLDRALDALGVLRWAWIGLATYQVLIAAYTAVGATKLAGLFIVLGEAVGVTFAVTHDGPVLETATYGFCIAAGVRAVLMLSLVNRSLLEPLRAATAPVPER
jgi:Na+-driven multidrug efflux pump